MIKDVIHWRVEDQQGIDTMQQNELYVHNERMLAKQEENTERKRIQVETLE